MNEVVFEAPVRKFGKTNPFKVDRVYRFRAIEDGTATWEVVFTQTVKRPSATKEGEWDDVTSDIVASRGSTATVIRDHWRQGCRDAKDAAQILKLCDGHGDWEGNAVRFGWARESTLNQLFKGELSYARFQDPKDVESMKQALACLEGKVWKECTDEQKKAFRSIASEIVVLCCIPPIDASDLEGSIWDPTPYLDQIK